MIYLAFLFCISINLYTISSFNISFATYQGLALPLNLLNHISVIYNDNIYIIGGSTDNHEASSNIYKSVYAMEAHQQQVYNNTFVPIGHINVSSSIVFPVNVEEIICENQCFTVIDNIIYIFVESEYIILLKYDLSSQSFMDLHAYNYFYNDSQFFGGCVLNDNGGRFIYSFGTMSINSADPNRIGLRYDSIDDAWDIIYGDWSDYERHSMGCAMDFKNENVYLFGGIEKEEILTDIQKYSIEKEGMVTLSSGSLIHPRSNIKIAQRTDHYFIIYSDHHSDMIEYFDANTETTLTYDTNANDNILFDVNLALNINNFASFMVDDIWFINGGRNENENVVHSEIKYVDTDRLFDVAIDQNTDTMSCTTVYAPVWSNLRDEYTIDAYIWQNMSKILFSVVHVSQTSSTKLVRPSITIKSSQVHYTLEYNFTNNSLNALHLRAAYLRSIGGPLRDSKKTIYHVGYPSVMWSSWDMNRLCSDSTTYFRGGVGTLFDKHSSNYRTGYCFTPSDIVTAYFYDYHEIDNTTWEFYHNECSLVMDVFIGDGDGDSMDSNVFSIGDYIHMNETLFRGTKLNTPIYVLSHDILNVNHSLFVNDDNECILCDRRHNNHLCKQCELGIQITDLATYGMDQNSYIITIHSNVLEGPAEFEFSRNIVSVELAFHDIDGNLIDFNAIYPSMEMYVTVAYDYHGESPPQYEGTVIIQWDEHLNLGNDNGIQFIELQFINDSCLLILNETNTVNCSYPIIVPHDMIFKSIQHNYYALHVYSNNTQLIANVPLSMSRKIQNISIVMSGSVAVGTYINISTTPVFEDTVYQTHTQISLDCISLNIKATVWITYDWVSNRAICVIYDDNTKRHSPCRNGIGPIYPVQDVEFGVVYLNSNDTYLSMYQHNISIVKATLGLVFMDVDEQQIVFEETLLYPGFHIYPHYYVVQYPAPHKITVYFEWDEALNMGNKHNIQTMSIQFDPHECLINVTETESMLCPDNPIIIPWNITYKTIYDNSYVFDVYSFDVALIGNAPTNKLWKRAIQNISMDVHYAVAVGAMINTEIGIHDDKTYQAHSEIYLYNDALGINHTMYISYDINTPLIIECSITNSYTFTTTSCDDGIGPIKPMDNTNHFLIDISSDDTYLVHNVMPIDITRVPLDVLLHDGNHTEIRFDEIYPGLEIYVSVETPDNSLVTPSEAIVYIVWDTALHIGDNAGVSMIIIRFDEHKCVIRLNTNHSMDCTEPIVVPYDMIYKPTASEHNQYSFDVYSYDVNLTRKYPNYLNRKAQSVAIQSMQETIAIHEYIPIVINTSDAQIYQKHSNITVKNEVLGIDSEIFIEYDLLSTPNDTDSFITNCYIKNYAVYHNPIEDCDTGLGQIIPQQVMDDSVVIIELDSLNTNLIHDTIAIWVHRMQVNVTFYDDNENVLHFNDSYIYPGMEIFIDVDYDKTVATQHEGQIFIVWDKDLYLGGSAAIHVMVIDFHEDECYISFHDADGDDASCNEAIMIPINMTYKAIADNHYDFDVYSFDTQLIASMPSFMQRKIQSVDVIFPDSIALGRYISIGIDIMDDMILQPTSTIRVESDQLQIDATIFVEYVSPSITITDISITDTVAYSDVYRDYIMNCVVFNHYSDRNESCEKGIGPITQQSSNIKLKDFVSLSSVDTFLKTEITQIPIITGETVDYNHWIAMLDSNQLITSICPNNQCCQYSGGCLYFSGDAYDEEDDGGYLCAQNRNHSVPLCASCDVGYAQVFNSASCEICDEDHWEYLLFPLCVAFIVTFIILSFDTKHNESQVHNVHPLIPLIRRDESEAISILIFRIGILFYQMINYILWQIGYTFWGTLMVQILSLHSYVWFSMFSAPLYFTDGVCFVQHLNNIEYYGWYLYFPGALLFSLMMYTLCKNTCCVWCCVTSSINNKANTRCAFGDYTGWNVILIALFPVLIVLLIVLSCKHIDDTYGTVHFYAAEIQCYGTEFMVAAAVLTLIWIFFIGCWLYLKWLGSSARQRNHYILKGIIRPYKPDWWFWEFVLLIRRLTIIIFVTLQYFGTTAMYITLLVLLFLFVIFELQCDPFKYRRALYMDLVCMIGVMLCLIIMMAQSYTEWHQSVTVISISIVILFPLLLLLWFVMDSIWRCYSRSSYRRGLSNRIDSRIQKMEQRLAWIGEERSPLAHEEHERPSQLVPDDDASSDSDEIAITKPKHKNRDTTLVSRIIEAECEESRTYKTEDEFGSKTKTKTKTRTRLLFVSRKNYSKKHKYQEIINQQIHNHDGDDDDDDDDDDGYEESESTTYSRKSAKVSLNRASLDTEMVIWNDDEEKQQDQNKQPFVRRTNLTQTKTPLTVIQENPEKKDDEENFKRKHRTSRATKTTIHQKQSGNKYNDGDESAITQSSIHDFGVVVADDSAPFISSGKNVKLQRNHPDHAFMLQYTGAHKSISQTQNTYNHSRAPTQHIKDDSATMEQSFNHTETTADDYGSSNDDDITATDHTHRTSDAIYSSETVHQGTIAERLQVISKPQMTQNMQNIFGSTDESSDSDHMYANDADSKAEEREAPSHRTSKYVEIDDIDDDHDDDKQQRSPPAAPTRVFVKPPAPPRKTSEYISTSPSQSHSIMGLNPLSVNNTKTIKTQKESLIGVDVDVDMDVDKAFNDRTPKQSYSSERGSITPFHSTPFHTPIQSKNNAMNALIHITDADAEDKDDSDSDKESTLDDMLNDVLSAETPITIRNTLQVTNKTKRHRKTSDSLLSPHGMDSTDTEDYNVEDNAATVKSQSESTEDQDIDINRSKSTTNPLKNINQFDDETKEHNLNNVTADPVALKLSIHRSTSSLNTIDEDRKLDEMAAIRRASTLGDLEEEDRINTPQHVRLQKNHPSQLFQYDHLHIDMEPMRQVSSHTSFRCESPVTLAAAKSHGLQNQSAIEHEYQYEYAHHEQERIKNDAILRTSTLKDIAINLSQRVAMSPSFKSGHSDTYAKHQKHKPTAITFQRIRKNEEEKEEEKEKEKESHSYSDASTTNSADDSDDNDDSESWNEYRQNLKGLFYLFAGHEGWSKKKGIYMTRNEVKRFLEIVEITKYWSVDQVFAIMDSAVIDNRITLDEFVEYFCNSQNNEKVAAIKSHIEKQVSWQLLLKALRIFDKMDVDRSGQLEYNEFVAFGKMLNLDDRETEILWKKIDKDENGQITIVELFEWFKERLETAKQSRKPKKTNAGEFSRSHSSFDDDSTDTRSIMSNYNDNQ